MLLMNMAHKGYNDTYQHGTYEHGTYEHGT